LRFGGIDLKVGFLLQYDSLGSSSKYRVLIYKDRFDEKYETKYFYFWSNRYLTKYMLNKKKYVLPIAASYIKNVIIRIFQFLFVLPKYDVLIIQRCLVPYLRCTGLLRRLKKSGVRIIYDIDDALHIDSKYDCRGIAEISDCVMVGNQLLKKYYEQYCSHVEFVPTVDNNLLYEEYKQDTFANKCIGWIGSAATVPNLEIIVNVVNRLQKEIPKLYLKVIADTSLGYENKIKNFKFVKWSKDTYMKEMSEFTIGIMPLLDNEFNKGKCGFKLIQYLDLCKPVIATDCGENKTIVGDYGFVCKTEEEWYNSIKELLNNEEGYRKLEQNINSDFLKKYGFVENFEKINKIILDLMIS